MIAVGVYLYASLQWVSCREEPVCPAAGAVLYRAAAGDRGLRRTEGDAASLLAAGAKTRHPALRQRARTRCRPNSAAEPAPQGRPAPAGRTAARRAGVGGGARNAAVRAPAPG